MKRCLVSFALLAACASAPTCPPPAAPAAPTAAAPATAALVVVASPHPHDETVQRAVAEIEARGLVVVQRIDHAAAARGAGLELAPATVLVFGNPKAGTPLMQAAPTFALDLPLRLLVWERDGKVAVAYRAPAAVAVDHGAADHPVVAKLAGVLAAVAAAATR